MKQEEQWAKDYLEHMGFSDPIYEPQKNLPPDFLINDHIAVEVTRLNQFRPTSSGMEPLAKLSAPLIKNLEDLFDDLGRHPHGISWYVFPNFKRPQLTKYKNLIRVLGKRLSVVMQNADTEQEQHLISIDPHFELRLIRRQTSGPHAFILGGYSDLDSGGWVMEELMRSISICIEEKTKKIAEHRNKYPKWWLILIDYVYAGEPQSISLSHNWDKVIIIHPRNFALAYEVPLPQPFDAHPPPPLP